jgi:hypothetical protein
MRKKAQGGPVFGACLSAARTGSRCSKQQNGLMPDCVGSDADVEPRIETLNR